MDRPREDLHTIRLDITECDVNVNLFESSSRKQTDGMVAHGCSRIHVIERGCARNLKREIIVECDLLGSEQLICCRFLGIRAANVNVESGARLCSKPTL